jgi:hypothetical protein
VLQVHCRMTRQWSSRNFSNQRTRRAGPSSLPMEGQRVGRLRSRAAARRYAQALLDVAIAEHLDLDRIECEVGALSELPGSRADLRSLLESPRLRREQKHAVRSARRPVKLSRAAPREAGYRRRGSHQRQSAHRSSARCDRPTARVNDGTDDPHRCADDPSIIGGVTAKVGSTVYDGSVSGQLARLREHLKRAA